MRIIGGTMAGKTFDSPGGHRTHPMSEKIRGAIFNILGDIKGLTVLDAYGGSGALGFEALSRGASQAMLLDADKNAALTMQQNALKLDVRDRATITKAFLASWLRRHPAVRYDLIFADPPYDAVPASAIQHLIDYLSETGVLVLSWPGTIELPKLVGVILLKNKAYGDAQLAFYARSS